MFAEVSDWPCHHPPQAHPITFKPLLSPARTVVDAVVLVAVHRHAHAHAAGQCVQRFEAVLVVAGRFVGDEDVGLLRGQLFQLVGPCSRSVEALSVEPSKD